MVKTVIMTESQYRNGSSNYEGKCLACGADAFNVEPDARKYDCECCGEKMVCGYEECLLMGAIEIVV